MKNPFQKKTLVVAIATILSAGAAFVVQAQSPITMDSTTGFGIGQFQDFSTTPGANQTIVIEGGGPMANGTTLNSPGNTNLFFSFSQFGITTGDTARFQCSGCGAINNVISRVTGTQPSSIDGTLQSTIANANFWFFNPKGVIFGAGAVIDVPAAFHISTAEQVNFNGGSYFGGSATDPGSSLTAAVPESFGFGASSTGDITITGTTISNAIGNGSTLESAKDVIISGAQILPTAGTLKITAQGDISTDSSSNVSANLIAGIDVDNNGTITGDAEATSGNLTNTNIISGNAIAGTDLSNTASGRIGGNATASSGILSNDGQITGDAEATIGNLTNTNIISGNAKAGADLSNTASGHIGGNATASSGILSNDGQITGDAEATIGNLANTNTISGNAKAGTDLTNEMAGNIGKNAAAGGTLTNRGGIGGNAFASGDITNEVGGTIFDGADAGQDIINNGTINGARVKAGRDIKNTGINASIKLDKVGDGVSAGRNLLIDSGNITATKDAKNTVISANNDLFVNNGGHIDLANTGNADVTAGQVLGVGVSWKDEADHTQGYAVTNGAINATNTGKVNVLAGTDLRVQGLDSNITANNTSGDAAIRATNNNLFVDNGGRIDLANIGNADVTAGQVLGVGVSWKDEADHTQGYAVTKGAINATNTGKVNVLASTDLRVHGTDSKITANNTGGDAAIIATNDLFVGNGGQIAANNTGSLDISAGTDLSVQDAGSAITTNDKVGNTSIKATKNLFVGNGGQISANNTGSLDISAGTDLSVQDAGSKITTNDKVGNTSLKALNNNLFVGNGGQISANNTGSLDISAGTDLSVQDAGSAITTNDKVGNTSLKALNNNLFVGNGGLVATTNTGSSTILAGTDLTVQGAGSKITANNTGGDTTISAGAIHNGTAVVRSTIGGNLTVANGGEVAKATGTGGLTVSALGKVEDGKGKITVTGNGSKISTAINHIGVANVQADSTLLVDKLGSVGLANTGGANIWSGTSLDVGNTTGLAADAGTIKVTNTGKLNVLAGTDLTVQGADSKITANNTGVDATISAGAIHNGTTVDRSPTGGNLKLANGGIIEKNAGTGSFKIDAKSVGLSTGNVTVTGSNSFATAADDKNSQIRIQNVFTGEATVAADKVLLVADSGIVKATNTGGFNALASTDLRVQGAGSKITADSTGNALITAGALVGGTPMGGNLTVTDGGIIEKTTGVGSFTAEAKYGGLGTGNVTVSGSHSLAVEAEYTASQIRTQSGLNGVSTVSAENALLVDKHGVISLANTGGANIWSGTTLEVGNAKGLADDAGTITATNTGALNVLAGKDLTVQGVDSKITADNVGPDTTLSAGAKLDNNKALVASGIGGNFSILHGGAVERSANPNGSSKLTLAAYSVGKTVTNGGQMIIAGAGSKLNADHNGDLILEATALPPKGLKLSSKENYAFRVSDGGHIYKNNSGNMNVSAATVYLGGSEAIVGKTDGNITFNGLSKGTSSLPLYFKMQDATMTNVGSVNLSGYTFKLDPSGIKSNTVINLNIYNPAEIVLPDVLVKQGSSDHQVSENKNFLDAPSILINGLKPKTDPLPNVTLEIGELMASSNKPLTLPKNPCNHSQSTLNTTGTANYIPDARSQVPYSVLDAASDTATTSPSSGASASKASVHLDDSVDCD
ncbi:MAG: filamentous hemagglutinin N-terminal domain-containing protein [Methylococcales bacterium]|nr:filamentous hemagglutinin N-terminal domain-containing protein [Methylococcales bacterium]